MNEGYLIDIGATNIRFGVCGISKYKPEIIHSVPDNSELIIKKIIMGINEIRNLFPNTKSRIVISSPGLITREGKVHKSIYTNLTGIYLKHEIEKSSKCEVFVENDANLQALGAYQNNSLLYMVIGTAVGGAYVFDGKIFEGSQGFACEFGHIYVGGKRNRLSSY